MGSARILPPDHGHSFWQPEPANGYVTVLVSPWTEPDTPFSMGTQHVPPGCHVREHTHLLQHEVIAVLSGRGTAEIDGRSHPMEPGTVLVLPAGVSHRFDNRGDSPLVIQWTISPPGLETFFKAIGQPREPGQPAPEAFQRPADPDLDGRSEMQVPLV
jgi:quercetin dioxygenase-like cupin family protein